ncbi:histidine--tRNA ligase [Micrococcales bacterium 31B]|nr:histidine--tRNA ligase [Micrococcales bacterium 31B]
MARPRPLSGFPEWLPEGRIVEQHVLDILRRTFELHGFAGIETRAVEPLSELVRKGEIDKEVYVLRRLQAEPGDDEADPAKQLGLHFDLTVPFARYTLENSGHLDFPFKRYQIQKVWRGERPQDGRFREFYQADIDVVAEGELPFHYEVELPLVMADALAALPIPSFTIRVNNRKIVEGFYRGLGFDDTAAVLRVIDKLEKIGPDGVRTQLEQQAGANESQVAACLALASIRTADTSFVAQVRALAGEHGVTDAMLEEGLAELERVLATAAELNPGVVVADLSIARGLDYYTGTVYETVLNGHESLGSICSGGRYDQLATDGKKTYPGVGLSIGVSRLVSRLISQGLVEASRKVPTVVLVAVSAEESRLESTRVAAQLRARGIAAEVSPSAAKFGKQIRHADRRGIPFVWIMQEDGTHAVKDIRSGEQEAASPAAWEPPVADLKPSVTLKETGANE